MSRAEAVPAIGVLSPLVSGFYFGGILDGVARAAQEAGYATVAFQCLPAGVTVADAHVPQRGVMRPVGWSQIAGFVSIVHAANDRSLLALRDEGKPLVVVSHEVAGLSCPIVMPDNFPGVRDAVRHLIEHGHRDIAFAGWMVQPDMRERYEAYRSALREAGIEPDPRLLYDTGDTMDTGGLAAGAAMLAAGLPHTAVVAGTDLNAIGILRALTAAGLELPRQQAVTGFDDTEAASYSRPALSTVAQDFLGLGRLAAGLLLDQINGEVVAAGPHRLPTRFVRRQSCGCGHTELPTLSHPPVRESRAAGSHLIVAPLAAVLIDQLLDPAGMAAERKQLVAALDRFGASFAQAMEALDERDVVVHEPARQLWPIVRGLDGFGTVAALLRRGALQWLEGVHDPAASGGPARIEVLRTRLEKLLLETVLSLSAENGRDHYERRTDLIESLSTQYNVGMDLLRSHQQEPTALGWLGRTRVRAGALGLFADPSDASTALTISGVYDPSGTMDDLVGTALDERLFPPQDLLRRALDHPGEVVVLLTVGSRAVARGALAAVAQVESRDATGRETFNQWAALVAVAMDHQQVLASMREQQTSLAESLSREHELAADIRSSEQRYALAAAAANDGLWDWDLVHGTVFYSDRSLSVLGATSGAEGIEAWLDRVHPEDRAGLDAAIAEQRGGTAEALEHEHRVSTDSGDVRWVLCRGLAVVDAAGSVIRIVGSLTDITDRRQLEDRLRHQALYDSLTRLPNRALLLDRLGVAMRRRVRHPDSRFAVLFIDLDGFKVINDSLGHVTGDKLLVGVAQRLQSFVRTGDTAARLGGDEFVVLLDDLRLTADVPSITERLQDMLAMPFDIGGHRVVVTASIGIATAAEEHESPDDMLRDADIAMYRAKTHQRGSQATFDATMRATLVSRMSTESLLRDAAEDGAFALHYQPIVSLESADITGFEALIRWPLERDGAIVLVPPVEFLPVAEETGLIVPIGRWVLEEVVRQAAAWRRAGHPAGSLPISVNVSHKEFWSAGLLDHLDNTLAAAGLDPRALVLEITEGVIMHNAAKAEALLAEMHERGLPVHIDDFGTGYSSLEALHRFRLDALKIDRSFVVAMSRGQRSAELVRTIIRMGESLGLDVIAEGIEEDAEVQMLQRFGCPYGQGYLFSRPLPADAVPGLFAVSPEELRIAAG
ncbi:hypothetical protein acdb102_35280 [Acidothermaceae bacterium B102]|nr:hypothetical protein acdb102_35280 [Acidothermaceae bacterium B102]